MRLGVLDVGSNTVHFLVVDAHPGAAPVPAYSHKIELRLAELLDDQGAIREDGVQRLVDMVASSMRVAEDKGVEEVLPFATSAVREAVNGEDVLKRVERETGVQLRVLSGGDEARLTFLAARRWYGWSAGRLLLLDIGGGSLEIASGLDEEPDSAVSLPLGAGRLTRDWLPGDPASADDVRKLRKHVRAEIAMMAGTLLRDGPSNHAVATSKTFRQLARVAGAAPSSEGLYVRRSLKHTDVTSLAERLPQLTVAERCELPGVSEGRAHQLAAGAIVADAAMDLLSLPVLEVCPWALREGVILRQLDLLPE